MQFKSNETAGAHHAPRRRGGGMAARGAKADSGTLSLGGLSRIGAAAELFSIPVSEIKGAIYAR
jgi:hypothetical protein